MPAELEHAMLSNVRFREPSLVPAHGVAAENVASVESHNASSEITKRGFDMVVAMMALFFLLPLISAAVVLLLLLQGRPIFIKHQRVGRGGQSFKCFKLRTMVENSDKILAEHLALNAEARHEWAASRKLKADPRVTPIGRVLRKSSLDELPQLYNILLGEMSFVGPRPIVQDEVVYYGSAINDYYKVRPGLTGLWQVSGRSDTSYDARVSLDSRYVQHRSLPLDLGIILRTVPAVLRSKGSY